MARTFRAFEYLEGSRERVFFRPAKPRRSGRACSRGKPTTTANYACWSILTFRAGRDGRLGPSESLVNQMWLRKIGEHSLRSSEINRKICIIGQRSGAIDIFRVHSMKILGKQRERKSRWWKVGWKRQRRIHRRLPQLPRPVRAAPAKSCDFDRPSRESSHT